MKDILREKVSQGQVRKEFNYIANKANSVEEKLDQIMSGDFYEILIEKRIKTKAELKDVEALDQSKADISAV